MWLCSTFFLKNALSYYNTKKRLLLRRFGVNTFHCRCDHICEMKEKIVTAELKKGLKITFK